ncbi:bacteriochlorophyll 4-vinyl reductase [Ideonella alba]|uniref:bacteriochlorophyll 4-vinyl reductase n=1 Tax=Ideonella alba TaxID=2824118 RepID=UPI002873A802|nr:bacteriochlorophyll 4-vinyl reductase [Ideonella alba]
MSAAAGRIGPNAILQVMAVLRAGPGEAACRAVLAQAGLAAYADTPPQTMVDEAQVQALHRVLREHGSVAEARGIGRAAGLATGDYLLAHRIPRPMRWLLPHLPATWSARVLLVAIRRHAWTFCGSGQFSAQLLRPGRVQLRLQGSATSRGVQADEPLCDYFAATFERLFQALVSPASRVQEVACAAMGAPACEFELDW